MNGNRDRNTNDQINEQNLIMLERVSRYLIQNPRMITAGDVQEVAACGVSHETAMRMLLAAALGFDEDRAMQERYLRPSLRALEAKAFCNNPYMRAIRFDRAAQGAWQLTRMQYAPYELFVRDDLLLMPDGREIPQLGYFTEAYEYPAVLQGGREWMTVTPNEVATMQPAIDAAKGHVAAMGLGLGYFAFMASRKEEVARVTVIERDADVIRLFERHILPQFPQRGKIHIVRADAFRFAQHELAALGAQLCFVDLWHDTLDGAPMYLRMKALERHAPQTRFMYWIETSIRSFLRGIEA